MRSRTISRTRRALCAGLAAFIILIVAAELVARHYGLHTPVLYEKTSYGYRPQPNQDIRRFGNRIFYNQYGMRSEPITPTPKPGVLRILCIGDSITNGGTITDQAATYPYLLEKLLREQGFDPEVLNASAAGWALENEAGWLRENGTFGAHVVVIEVASHDLFQPLAPAATVDNHPSFPSDGPSLALQELGMRYLLPRLFPGMAPPDPGTHIGGRESPESTVARLLAMAEEVRGSDGEAILLQVVQPPELEPTDPITLTAKQVLRAKLLQLEVPLVETAAVIDEHGGRALFRDAFHPNEQGNAVLAKVVSEAVLNAVKSAPR